MSTWVKAILVTELPLGKRLVIDVDGVGVLLFHIDDGFYAIEDTCTHDRGQLTNGELRGNEIVCPRHGARFCLKTGAVTAPPAYEPLAVLPTRVLDGWVEVRDDRWD